MLSREGISYIRINQAKCRDCKYFEHLDGFMGICCYIFFEGHRRPCPPGHACTAYRCGRHSRKRKKLKNQ